MFDDNWYDDLLYILHSKFKRLYFTSKYVATDFLDPTKVFAA
jgi:hypothetical protein